MVQHHFGAFGDVPSLPYFVHILSLLGDIFCCSDTQYNTNQTAVSTIHIPVNDYLVPLVTCTLTAAIICLDTMLICCCLLNTIIVIIIEFWEFSWSLLCYTLVSVLVLGIGIAIGQYYWVLDIGCLSWYRFNPIGHMLNRVINKAPNIQCPIMLASSDTNTKYQYRYCVAQQCIDFEVKYIQRYTM